MSTPQDQPADAPAEQQTVTVPDPANPDQTIESPVEADPARVDTPCPNCGRAPTEVGVQSPVAANPPVDPDTGSDLEGGETVHYCPHCGHLIAVVKGAVDKAAAALQRDYEKTVAAAYTDAHPDAPAVKVETGPDGEPVAVTDENAGR